MPNLNLEQFCFLQKQRLKINATQIETKDAFHTTSSEI